MVSHTHVGTVSSCSTSANNNNPIGFGLDIIYMDMDTWESSVCSFPEGGIVMSDGMETDASFSSYDAPNGKFIVHTTPETTVGTTTPQQHTITITTKSGSAGGTPELDISGLDTDGAVRGHSHTLSTKSNSIYVEPRALVVKLYLATQEASKAIKNTVVFVDGSVSSNWQILTSWAGGNLKAGSSTTGLSGTDTHTHSEFVEATPYWEGGADAPIDESTSAVHSQHYHTVRGTLSAANHVPSSRLIVAAKLLNTLERAIPVGRGPQLIGPLW